MRNIARTLFCSLLLIAALSVPARAEDYLACYVGGTFKLCPGDVRLKAGKYLLDSYIPGLDAAKVSSGTLDIARLPVGSISGTVASGNDVRFNQAPSGGGKICYDNGTGYSCTGGTSVQVLVGGSTPGFGSVPAAAITALTGTLTGTYTLGGTPTISAPAISSPVFSGSATGTYTLAGTPTITAPSISGPTLSGTVLGTYTLGGTPTIPASGLSGQASVANGGTGQASLTNHGVLLGQGASAVISPALGSTGQLLTSNGASSDPSFQSPVTANIATAVATATTLADTSGTYTDVTGATLSLTAGTHIVATTLRAEIGATTGAGAFITCRLHDGTNPITSTETLITQDNQLLVLAQNTTTLIWPVTVGSTTSVKAQCTRVFSGTLFTSDIPSDSNGRSRMFSVQTAP